jgi:hypothetical protein
MTDHELTKAICDRARLAGIDPAIYGVTSPISRCSRADIAAVTRRLALRNQRLRRQAKKREKMFWLHMNVFCGGSVAWLGFSSGGSYPLFALSVMLSHITFALVDTYLDR